MILKPAPSPLSTHPTVIDIGPSSWAIAIMQSALAIFNVLLSFCPLEGHFPPRGWKPPELQRRRLKSGGLRRIFVPMAGNQIPQNYLVDGGSQGDTKSKPDEDSHRKAHRSSPMPFSCVRAGLSCRADRRGQAEVPALNNVNGQLCWLNSGSWLSHIHYC